MALVKAAKQTGNIIESLTNINKEKPVVTELLINKLVPYRKHPFALYEGERLDDMVESVSENGVLTPIIVQPIENEQYEILAGHNRWNASKIAGKETIPAIIKTGLTEEEAYVYVVETNVYQRGFDNLKLSEQAAVIAERADEFREEKREAIRTEIRTLNGEETEEVASGRTDVAVGEEYSMNSKRVARLIRIHRYLVPELKEILDRDGIPFIGAIDLSFLSEEQQREVADLSECYNIDLKKCSALKELAVKGELTDVEAVIGNVNKAEQTAPKMKPVKIRKDVFDQYFNKDADRDYVQSITECALKEYFENHPQMQED